MSFCCTGFLQVKDSSRPSSSPPPPISAHEKIVQNKFLLKRLEALPSLCCHAFMVGNIGRDCGVKGDGPEVEDRPEEGTSAKNLLTHEVNLRATAVADDAEEFQSAVIWA